MSKINWMDTPLEGFSSRTEKREDGSCYVNHKPYGDDAVINLLIGLSADIEETYISLLSEEDYAQIESSDEVPILRDGDWTYESLDRMTVRDLPAILDALAVLEDERKKEQQEEERLKAAKRRERKNTLARERNRRKKLGEW